MQNTIPKRNYTKGLWAQVGNKEPSNGKYMKCYSWWYVVQEVLQYIITVSTVLWDMAMHTYTLDITYNTSVMVLLYTYSKKQKQKKNQLHDVDAS